MRVKLPVDGRTLQFKLFPLKEQESVVTAEQQKLITDPTRVNRIYQAEASTVDTKEILAVAYSVCVKPDQFVKKVGSRLAITKLLNQLKLQREDRKAVFAKIFHSSKTSNS